MARRPRIHFPDALYHVIARGNQKQDIFLNDKDFKTYLSYLSEYKTKYHFHLYAYALMKNHLHLLMQVEEVPLSKIMQVMQFRYTRYFNRHYGKVGHLFQGRYKAILCDKDSYLLELVRYIHLNPVRANIVDTPEKYSWTSHSVYFSKIEDDLIEQNLVLSQLSQNKSYARKALLRFILGGLNAGRQEKYYRVKEQVFLGDDEFVEEIENKKGSFEPRIYDVQIEKIVSEVSEAIGIPENRLYSLTKNRSGAYGRSLVAYLARKIGGYLVRDIAEHFHRQPMTISQAIIKLETLIQRDEDLEKTVESLERNLIKGGKAKYLISIA